MNATPPPTTPNRRRTKKLAARLLILGLAAPLIPLLAAWTPPSVRPFRVDLVSHFVPHALAACALLLLLAGAIRAKKASSAAALCALAALLTLLIAYRPFTLASAPPGAQRVRVVQFNALNVASANDDAFLAWLLDQDADLVALVDAPPALLQRSETLQARYPYQVAPQRGWHWPIVLLSKHPMRPAALAPNTKELSTSFVARRSVAVTLPNGAEVLFTALHPYSPRNLPAWRRSLEIVNRDGELLRNARERSGMPIIVAGDFNSTPTGRVFRTFARRSGLRAPGALPVGTWPASMPRPLGVAIDHVFASPDIIHLARTVGPAFRSDHRPIVVDLAVPAPVQSLEPEEASSESAG